MITYLFKITHEGSLTVCVLVAFTDFKFTLSTCFLSILHHVRFELLVLWMLIFVGPVSLPKVQTEEICQRQVVHPTSWFLVIFQATLVDMLSLQMDGRPETIHSLAYRYLTLDWVRLEIPRAATISLMPRPLPIKISSHKDFYPPKMRIRVSLH